MNIDLPIKKLENNTTVQTSNGQLNPSANASPKNINTSHFEPNFKRSNLDDNSVDLMADPPQSFVDKNEDPLTGRSGILHEDHTTQALLPAIGEVVNEKSVTNNTAKGDTSKKKKNSNNHFSSQSKNRGKRVAVASNIQGKDHMTKTQTPSAIEELNKELN